jgi:hypothetical protein
MTKRWFGLWLVALLVSFPALLSAKDLTMASTWMPRARDGQGAVNPWAGRLMPLDDYPALFGVENDAAYLYVCLRTSDPGLKRELARFGLTVWANGDDKDRRAYGVRFPVRPTFARHGDEGGWEGPPPAGDGRARGAGVVAADQMELIGPTDDDRLVVRVSSSGPVQASMRDDAGVMVIELRLPLAPTDAHPLAIEARPGRPIALGFETELPRMRRGSSRRGGGLRGGGEGERGGEPGEGDHGGFGGGGGWGGRGGGGVGPGGGMGRGMEGERSVTARPIRTWVRVHLALAPAPPVR